MTGQFLLPCEQARVDTFSKTRKRKTFCGQFKPLGTAKQYSVLQLPHASLIFSQRKHPRYPKRFSPLSQNVSAESYNSSRVGIRMQTLHVNFRSVPRRFTTMF